MIFFPQGKPGLSLLSVKNDNGIENIQTTVDVTDPSIQNAVYAELKNIFEEYSLYISSAFLNEQGLAG